MGDEGRQAGDEDWLDPEQTKRPLIVLFQEGRGFFVRLSALALFVALVVAALRPTSPSATGKTVVPVGPPPTDRQLLWFTLDPAQDPLAVRIQAIDWSGHELGTLSLPCRGPCSFTASPDGQRLLVYEQPAEDEPATPGSVYDARGRRTGTVVNPSAKWADDSRHLCLLRGTDSFSTREPLTGQADLVVVDSDTGQTRVAASVAGVNGLSGPAYWELLACSVTADRALITFSEQRAVHDVLVLQLSTGRTLYARHDLTAGTMCGCLVTDMAAAPTAGLAVENLAGGNIQLRNLSTGTTAPWPAGSVTLRPVLALSWQGHRALTPGGIIELKTGRVIWRAPSPFSASLAAARPGSDDLLVYVSQPSAIGARQVIVEGDGSQISLAIK